MSWAAPIGARPASSYIFVQILWHVWSRVKPKCVGERSCFACAQAMLVTFLGAKILWNSVQPLESSDPQWVLPNAGLGIVARGRSPEAGDAGSVLESGSQRARGS